MTIYPISAFSDNYIWAWIDNISNKAWVVDPGEAAPVIKTLQAWEVELGGILLTHHHYDHTNGVPELLEQWPDCKVYGSTISPHAFITHRVQEGDVIDCGSQTFNVLNIPGHTLEHIAFWNDDTVFSGDTLFSAGCGRVFEGTPPQMYQSLQKLLALSPDLKLYCGHEYTEANLKFAALVEPDNTFIQDKIKQVQQQRKNQQSTLPSTLKEEKTFNPFLRCSEADVIQAAEGHSSQSLSTPVEVFAVLREWKNKL